jgi:hypothetical protein
VFSVTDHRCDMSLMHCKIFYLRRLLIIRKITETRQCYLRLRLRLRRFITFCIFSTSLAQLDYKLPLNGSRLKNTCQVQRIDITGFCDCGNVINYCDSYFFNICCSLQLEKKNNCVVTPVFVANRNYSDKDLIEVIVLIKEKGLIKTLLP